ncbi:hypothetical protein HII36_22130 [Nonomuraea sp. NN258]|uniref:MEDS domain-containing protein n=1 Tax=Nonomuraea antri TaxID=2730852 RepID=UPI001568FEFF|nr:MEDS domain-containing protein [Nonomuraea antri]NRQ34526.1 hypothetical protein [Nonomuraea antri]
MQMFIEPTEVSRMRWGDHLCFTYSCEQERAQVLLPYLRQGLAGGDKVLYIADSADSAHVPDLINACTRGQPHLFLDASQLVLARAEDTYLAGDAFDPDAMIELLMYESAKAVSEGFTALRATGETSWALRLPAIEQFILYEREVGRVFATARAMAICQYDRRLFPAPTLRELHAVHQGHVGPDPDYHDEQVRIFRTYQPPGLRIAGALHAGSHQPLQQALAGLDDVAADIHLELSRLEQLDLDTVRLLLSAARRRTPRTRLVLDNLGIHHRRLLELVNVGHVPGLAMNYSDNVQAGSL